jgi:pyruvate formate lyase activating enzyme
MNSSIDYEFRTTVVKEFHDIEDFHQIGQMIKGAKNYYLQSYQAKDSVIDKFLHPLSKDELQSCLKVVKQYVENVCIRGID